MPEEGEFFENTKGVIIIFISKKNRQHIDQKKKYKTTNNHLQNTRGTYPWSLVRHIAVNQVIVATIQLSK